MNDETTQIGGRFDHEGDWSVRELISAEDRLLNPEEYVARHAHEWGCFSFHKFRYQDPALGAWVRRVGELLFSEGEVERCREQFLSPDELAVVRRRDHEDF